MKVKCTIHNGIFVITSGMFNDHIIHKSYKD
jgi:hypothetical protein